MRWDFKLTSVLSFLSLFPSSRIPGLQGKLPVCPRPKSSSASPPAEGCSRTENSFKRVIWLSEQLLRKWALKCSRISGNYLPDELFNPFSSTLLSYPGENPQTPIHQRICSHEQFCLRLWILASLSLNLAINIPPSLLPSFPLSLLLSWLSDKNKH